MGRFILLKPTRLMSEHSHPQDKSDPFLPILGTVVLLLVLGALGWILIANPEPPALDPTIRVDFAKQFFTQDRIGFELIDIDTERIALERAKQPPSIRPNKGEYDRLVAAYMALSRAEVKSTVHDDVEIAGRAFVIAGRDIYGHHGSPGIFGAIDVAYPDFRAALTRLATASHDLKIPPEILITNPPKDLEHAIAWAGAFIILARRMELMSPTGAIPRRLDPIIEILFRYRWINSCRGAVVPQQLLTPTEFVTLNLWRLHEAQNIDEKRRHRYVLNLAATISRYPGDAADGVVYFQHGNLLDARQSFQKAMADKDIAPVMERYITLLDAIKTPQPPPKTTPDAAQILPTKPDAAPPQPTPIQP